MSQPNLPLEHIAAARGHLGTLAGIAAKTRAAEEKIRDAARDRLAHVSETIDRLRPSVLLDGDAAEQYQAATLERGQLETVIANADRHLAN